MGQAWKTVKWQMLYFFTLESLGYLLSKGGFRIVSHVKRALGKQYSTGYILGHIMEDEKKRAGFKAVLEKIGIGNLDIYLNLYEYLNVVALKERTNPAE
ncbi:MAG: hypothetical protein JW821_16530 [Deltaproteobacteria bacterium]|nr:hypothetical protein [Deltaproteobacteria bacterium]